MLADLFYRVAVAAGIGLLIGLERQFRKQDGAEHMLFAGARTFPMLALAGFMAAMLAAEQQTSVAFAVPMTIVGALLVVSYLRTSVEGSLGMTTEVAAVLTLLIGALCYHGQIELAAALGVAVLGLLSLKIELHRLSHTLTSREIISLAKFGLITAIVLPVLPDEPLLPPPVDVVSSRNVWLMVILVSAISFVGYILKKLLGDGKAIVLTGFLGGLVSSTAVTMTFSARSMDRPKLSSAFAVAIVVAWTTMFLRVIVEVAVVNRDLVAQLWIPMVAAAVAGFAYCLIMRRKDVQEQAGGEDVDVEQPFSLKSSLKFGGLYALVLIIARLAQTYFGDEGIYVSAIATGFTDVDAITLSMAELSQEGGSVDPRVAVNAITLAAVTNTLVKAGIVLSTAHSSLRKAILPGVVAIVVAALGAIYLV